MGRLLLIRQCRLHGFRHRMGVGADDMKCELALNSIADGYRPLDTPRLWNRLGNGISNRGQSGLRWGQRPASGPLAGDTDRKLVSGPMPEQDMSLSSANAEHLKQAFQQCRDMEGTLSEQLDAYAAAGREVV